MRKIYSAVLLLFMSSIGIAQTTAICDDPAIASWQINTDGQIAEYNTDCCPVSGTETLTVMTEEAGIQSVWYTDDYMYINTTSLAYYTMGTWATALTPVAQDLTFRIPREVTEETSGEENTASSGTIGIAVNGVGIFSETSSRSYDGSDNTGAGYDIWNTDAWIEEGYSMDDAGGGHPTSAGYYHYHATPFALYTEASAGHSPIIGWGLDGVPIYGPYGYDDSLDANSAVVRMESGYQLRNITERKELPSGEVIADPTYWGPDVDDDFPIGTYAEDNEFVAGLGHLDKHNGRWCVTPEYPNGVYAYFITIDEDEEPKYPYIIGPEYYGETSTGSGGYASVDASAEEYDPELCEVAACTAPDVPTLAADFTEVCQGESVTISISSGELNDATAWVWYTESCGGTEVGTGTSLAVTPNGTTTYYVRGEGNCDGSNCATIDITVFNLPPLSISDDVSICAGESTTISASGPGSIQWDNSLGTGSSFTVSPTSSTTYKATNTVSNGCQNEAEVTVSVTNAPTVDAGIDQTICADATVSLSGNITVASGGAWTTSGDGVFANASSLSTTYTPSENDILGGSITLTLTSTGNGTCSEAQDMVTVIIDAIPTADAGVDQDLCSATTSLGATAVSVGTGQWSVVSGSGSITTVENENSAVSGLSEVDPLTARWTVSNGVCADATDDVLISRSTSAAVSVSISETNATICTGDAQTFTAIPVNEGSAPTYDWYVNGESAQNSTSETYTYTPTSGDEVHVILTSDLSCASGSPATSGTTTVTVASLPTVSAGLNTSICEGESTTLTASGAASYSWDNDLGTGASPTVSPSIQTTYTVIGTSNDGCQSTDEVTISINENPTVDAGVDIEICEESSTTLSASGASTYEWDNDLGTGASQIVTPSSTSTYMVTGTDANGCTNTDEVNVTVNSAPQVVASSDLTICTGDNTTISATGASTYEWDNSLGTGSSHTISPTFATTYEVTGTDDNGCVSTDMVTVTVDNALSANAGADQSLCAESAVLGATTPTTGTGAWSIVSGTGSIEDIEEANTTVSGLEEGNTLVVKWTVTHGSCSAVSDEVSISRTSSAVVAVSITPDDPSLCEGDEQEFTAIPVNEGDNPTYEWFVNTISQGAASANATTFEYAPSQGDAIEVVLTSDLSCATGSPATSSSVSITVNSLPEVDAGDDLSICEGESIELSVEGALSYEWDNDIGVSNSPSVSPSSTTTYIVIGTDANGCETEDEVEVTVNSNPTITVSNDVTICEESNTTIIASGADSYEWDNNLGSGATQDVSPTTNTVYSVEGTDVNGCAGTALVEVTVDELPLADAGSDQTSCSESVTLGASEPSVGTGMWSIVSGSGSITSLSSSQSDVTGLVMGDPLTLLWTVSNGVCTAATDEVVLTRASSADVSVDISPMDVTICDGSNQEYTATAVNVGNTATYEWFVNAVSQGTSSESSFTISQPTTGDKVSVSVTSASGCATGTADSDTSEITTESLPVVNAGTDQTICFTPPNQPEDVALNGSVSGVSSASWSTTSFGTFSPSATDLEATYSVTPEEMKQGVAVLTLTSAENACGQSSDDMIITIEKCTTTTAIESSLISIPELNVYPNPTEEFIHIEITAETTVDMSIIVYDMLGTIIYQTSNEAVETIEENVTLTGNAGIYMIKAVVNDQVYTKRILKL